MSFKQPEIYYEESHEGITNGLPFFHVSSGSKIPTVFFIGSVFDTDELVEGTETGEKVKEVVVQSYYNSQALKESLDEETYFKVKKALGLVKN